MYRAELLHRHADRPLRRAPHGRRRPRPDRRSALAIGARRHHGRALLDRRWFCSASAGISASSAPPRSCRDAPPEERDKVQAFNDFLVFGTMAVGSSSSGHLLAHYGWNSVNLVVFPVVAIALALLFAHRMRSGRPTRPPDCAENCHLAVTMPLRDRRRFWHNRPDRRVGTFAGWRHSLASCQPSAIGRLSAKKRDSIITLCCGSSSAAACCPSSTASGRSSPCMAADAGNAACRKSRPRSRKARRPISSRQYTHHRHRRRRDLRRHLVPARRPASPSAS